MEQELIDAMMALSGTLNQTVSFLVGAFTSIAFILAAGTRL